MPITRRSFLALTLGLWHEAVGAAQKHFHAMEAVQAEGEYSFRFFTEPECETVRKLAARIAPANERSGGAAAARVEEYIDLILSHAAEELRESWRGALARVAPRVRGRTPEEIDSVLNGLAQNEFNPETPDEEFFVLLKTAVVEGFYTSEEGIRRELGYVGNTYLAEFPGCTHESHQPPPGYRPLLPRARRS